MDTNRRRCRRCGRTEAQIVQQQGEASIYEVPPWGTLCRRCFEAAEMADWKASQEVGPPTGAPDWSNMMARGLALWLAKWWLIAILTSALLLAFQCGNNPVVE
jgi:hypothetical protein